MSAPVAREWSSFIAWLRQSTGPLCAGMLGVDQRWRSDSRRSGRRCATNGVRTAARMPYHGPYRWLPVQRFPYVLYYEILDPTRVRVYAVAHTSRRPGYWLQRRRCPGRFRLTPEPICRPDPWQARCSPAVASTSARRTDRPAFSGSGARLPGRIRTWRRPDNPSSRFRRSATTPGRTSRCA